MTFVTLIIGSLLILGLAFAIYEWRWKRVVLRHDMRQDTRDTLVQAEAREEFERTTGAIRDRIMFDHLS